MDISVKKAPTPAGDATIVRLTNAAGAWVELCNIGAGICAIAVPDKQGRIENVVLGYADPADYLADGPCMGKTPGRYANRIAAGIFSLDGTEHTLAVNLPPNHLHGGPTGFQTHLWKTEIIGESVRFSLFSPDGDENYPGNLVATVTYTWSEDCSLTIAYQAVTDASTVINLTNHSYFNLDGEGSGCALRQTLHLSASRWLPTDSTLVPTGEMAPVAGTPMDFTVAKEVGRDIHDDFPALRYGKGYDNCWVLDGWQPGLMVDAATLCAARSGRVLTVRTDQPAVQVYTANWMDGSPLGRCGRHYNDYDAVAIECQGMPDAPNRPGFPSQTLRPGEVYKRMITYSFSTK